MFNRAGEVTPDDRSLVGRMASVIAHRGPDDSGCYAKGPIALGQRQPAHVQRGRIGLDHI
jgi:asparagine synthetase B (glutamine-hydrolysing)